MKTLGKILLAVIGLILIAVLALVLLVDANRFKPHIEKAAAQQGIALSIKGDLEWSLWPSIGVEINELSVAAVTSPTQPLAELKRASLLLKLMPLFAGDFQVDHLLVDGARIHLAVDKKGRGNWQDILDANASADAKDENPAESAAESDSSLTLAIQDISLTDSHLQYLDEQSGQSIELRDINVHLSNVNTRSEAFPLSLALIADIEQAGSAPLVLDVSATQQLSVDASVNNIRLTDGELQLGLGKSPKLTLQYQLALKNLQDALSYEGLINLKDTNLRPLLAELGTELETADNSALKQFSLSASLAGDEKQVQLNPLTLVLDKTRFEGDLAITDLATSAIKVQLKGDRINVDDYLPPPSESDSETSAATGEDTPLPLDALRNLQLSAAISLQEMVIKQLQLQKVALTVDANKGRVTQSLSANAYQGALVFNSKTDARSDKATVTFDGNLQQLELAPLLTALEVNEKFSLSGAIQANTQGTAQGATVNQLLESMNSTASFSGAQVRLAPLNIEEQFCKLVSLVTQNTTDVKWDDFTEMRQLDGAIVWRDQVINLQHFNAGVSQLLLGSTGNINLATNRYEFKLPIKIASASEAATLKGCNLSTSNYWVDRGLSLLRCKGSFDAIDPLKDCGFDKSAVGELTKDFAEYKLREKHGDKIEAAEQKVEEKKQEVKAQVEEKKQELVNKLQNKLFKTAASSSAAASSVASE